MKNSATFARSSVERHANIKINESQVFSIRDAFFVASRGQFISRVHVQLNINSLQNFGFSEHPRKLPKALTRVITEIDVPIGKTARSQYVDFHTSCESQHKNGTSKKNCSLKFLNLERAKMFTTQISCNLTSQMNTTRVVITTKYSMTQSCFEALALLTAKPWIPRFI